MNLNEHVREQLLQHLQEPTDNEIDQLNSAFRLLAKWRSVLISNTIIASHETHVLQGPMRGLEYVADASEGCLAARLIGCYEQPLLPFVEKAIQADYVNVVNIGCSDGYYAVGMARRMTKSKVWAYDINPAAQDACRELAKKNDVCDRIEVGALFSPENFAQFANEKTLVMCDIEGAEQELLDPQLAPDLLGMDIIVESHECIIKGLTQTLVDRFSLTHEITLIQDTGQRQFSVLPKGYETWANLDQLVATWEWRSGPTPWMVMTSKVLQTDLAIAQSTPKTKPKSKVKARKA
tara:strand:- start:148 stop:1026 length:879 start_codon:yes stop_codon:yes gene_type:complete